MKQQKIHRILLVEDDLAIADAIATNLKYSNYQYQIFHNGLEAAQSLEVDSQYDLSILDIMLPGLGGFALLKYMKDYSIPVIYITAKTDSDSEIKGLLDGAEDYIVKPFKMMTLLVRMEKVLSRHHKTQDIYLVGELQIDMMNRIVTRHGLEIKLTPIEFQVFEILVKYRNRTISRDTLLDEVWANPIMGIQEL